MVHEVLCVLDRYITKNGRQVTNYMKKNGENFSEVVTNLGSGEKGIREIYPNKVVDKVYGRIEEYRPERQGVVQISEGIKSYFPNIKFSKLTQID